MREDIIQYIANHLSNLKVGDIIIVAIDGIDASGKTSFANEVKEAIKNRPVLRLSMDDFHNPKEQRIKRGYLSPEGYYYDSFDYAFLLDQILKPLKGGVLKIPTKLFDYKTEQSLVEEWVELEKHTIIIFDGVFMMRDQLIEFWDYSIFLEITFDEALNRGLRRDIHYFNDQRLLIEKYNKRYLPGQSIYLTDVNPKDKVDMVIDHNDFSSPQIILEK
ncbi:MAG: hypothetical protein JXR88_04690 [Clostridia bacterium]|nr:hypothetical protein [Clostridia bacterium]